MVDKQRQTVKELEARLAEEKQRLREQEQAFEETRQQLVGRVVLEQLGNGIDEQTVLALLDKNLKKRDRKFFPELSVPAPASQATLSQPQQPAPIEQPLQPST